MQGVTVYRILFLTSDSGIIEVQITLFPKFDPSTIQFEPLSKFDVDAHYMTGFSYLLNKYTSTLDGAVIEKIGKVNVGTNVYYVIYIRVNSALYQAILISGNNMEVLFDQLSLVEQTQTVSALPSNNLFMPIDSTTFRNDVDYPLIFEFLSNARPSEIKGSRLDQIWIYSEPSSIFYIFIFSNNGVAYLKQVKLDPVAKKVSLVS